MPQMSFLGKKVVNVDLPQFYIPREPIMGNAIESPLVIDS